MKLTRLLAFAAIGTAVGLLLTTKQGKELRKDVANRGNDLLKKLNKLSKDAAGDVQDVAGNARQMAKEYV
jgi:gas vesicle protein